MIWNSTMEMSYLKNEVNDEEVSNYDKSKNKVKNGWFHTGIKKTYILRNRWKGTLIPYSEKLYIPVDVYNSFDWVIKG